MSVSGTIMWFKFVVFQRRVGHVTFLLKKSDQFQGGGSFRGETTRNFTSSGALV